MLSAGDQSRTIVKSARDSATTAAHMAVAIAVIVNRRVAGSGRIQARTPSDPKYANDTHSEERTLGNLSGMLVYL